MGRQNGVDRGENGNQCVDMCDTAGARKSLCKSSSASNAEASHIKAPGTHINAEPEVCRGEPHPRRRPS